MTVFAARIAACIASTLVPSEQNPWRSGGVALTKTASSGNARDSKRRGTSERKTGHVVRPPLVHGGPGVRPDEQGAVAKVRRHIRGQVRARPFDVQVDDADIVQVRRPRDECVEQH